MRSTLVTEGDVCPTSENAAIGALIHRMIAMLCIIEIIAKTPSLQPAPKQSALIHQAGPIASCICLQPTVTTLLPRTLDQPIFKPVDSSL
jgi:hypothetical protein